MNGQQNIKIVEEIYQNILKGNLPGVLERFSEDTLWKEPTSGPAPFAGTYKGKKEITAFFIKMNEICEIIKFELRKIIAHENLVIALCYYQAKSRSTSKQWETDFVEIWQIERGKVVEFQIFKDSAAELLALQPELVGKSI
ncbi:MAG TPA: nuclear transport factor 2 family protein [Ignavibacteriaceae bacterium]|nr:nuclear transport factor 2 family protein [Ignavibacteriaceae bacterium]